MSSAPCCGGPLPPAFMGGVSTLKAGRLTRLQVLPIKNVRVQRDMGHDPEPVLGHEEPHGVYMCGHVCTCVHVTCTHARACVCGCACSVPVCMCAYACMCACAYMHTCACTYLWAHSVCTCVHVHVCACVCCVYMSVDICVDMYVYSVVTGQHHRL